MKRPYITDLEPGTYYLCQCGGSADLPFCDGSHQGTGRKPLALEVKEPMEVGLCMCGASGNKPFCDGSHKTLK